MDLQEEIALDLNTALIGSTVRVLVEQPAADNPDGYAVGRTQWDSPEVDPEVLVRNCSAHAGEFINVRITGAEPFELIGEYESV